jgi:hypothetical protein
MGKGWVTVGKLRQCQPVSVVDVTKMPVDGV